MKIACNLRMAPGDTNQEKFEAIKQFGFEGVEVRLLETDLTPKNLDEIERLLDKYNLKASSLVILNQGFSVPLDSMENLEWKKAAARESLKLSARFNAGTFVLPEYRAQSPLPLWDGRKRMTSSDEEMLYAFLSYVADYANQVNGFALLEPINRYETHFYSTIQEVKTVIDKVSSDRLKIVADFFHMNIEEQDISQSILNGAGYIAHVQLGDSNRLLPGNGHTDFLSGFAALYKIGYQGYLALECQIPENPSVEYPKCVHHLQSVLSQAHEISTQQA